MHHINEFLSAAHASLEEIHRLSTIHSLSSLVTADHLGFRSASHEEYETIRTLLESHATFLYQSIISQRRISIIKLKKAIATSCGDIWYIELADQKPDHSQKSGFDHIECYPKDLSIESCITQLRNRGLLVTKKERPHHTTFDLILPSTFTLKIEEEPLIQKIIREEINS